MQQIENHLQELSLHTIREIYEEEAIKAAKTKLSYQDYLLRLVEQQVLTKIDRSINRKISIAGFPFIRRVEEFDFSYQPSLDEKLIRELAMLNFLNDARNVVFLGPPGVGKTHLAIALGVKACMARKRVLFYIAEDLVDELASAEASATLQKKLDTLFKVDLLIIDELGYLELSKKAAKLFFQLISKRYEKGSIIVTANKPFEEWGNTFQDDVVASAIIDRLLHHCYTFSINGKSYRVKDMSTNNN